MPTWAITYWKPLSAAVVVAILVGLWHVDRAHQYRRGAEDTAASIRAKLSEKAAERAAAVLRHERQQRGAFAERQKIIEQERDDAKLTASAMRRELDGLRRHAEAAGRRAAVPPADGAAGAPNETAAEGWVLLGQCAAEYAEVAETADRQRNDLAEWQEYGKLTASAAAQ